MATITTGSYTADTISDLIDLIESSWDWSSTDFTTTNQWDFVVDSSKLLRINLSSTSISISVVLNGTVYSAQTANSRYNLRIEKTSSALSIAYVASQNTSPSEVTAALANHFIITGAENQSTGDSETVILFSNSANSTACTMYASDVLTPVSIGLGSTSNSFSGKCTVATPLYNKNSAFICTDAYGVVQQELSALTFASVTLGTKDYYVSGWFMLADD